MKFSLTRLFSRLGLRLMLFNCLLVFLPLAALMFLDVFESRMLDSQENTMASQVRVLASSLGASLDSFRKVDQANALAGLAKDSLDRLNGRTITRLRILSADRVVLADSSRSVARTAAAVNAYPITREKPASGGDFSSLVYRLGSLPFRLWRSLNPPPAVSEESDDNQAISDNAAVLVALDGHYGSQTRVSSGQRSVTLYAALPVELRDGTIAGVVLASQSTWRTLQTIYEIRRSLFQIFLVSLVLALALSFLLSLTISRPLRRMQAMADGFIDQWGRPTGSFRPVRGSDELASLSRALVRLGDGLSDHVHFIGSFASDLAHELRNPLASIRAAADLLDHDPKSAIASEQVRLAQIIRSETERIDRLVILSRDLSQLDLAIGRSPRQAVDSGEILLELVRSWELRGQSPVLDQAWRHLNPAARTVLADPDFLRQALEKILENALDFSTEAKSVRVSLLNKDGQVLIAIADRGPGISDAMKPQIFRRFHTERRDAGHTGLGLSLAKSIIEAYGGAIELSDNPGGGAIFTVKLQQA